MNLSIGSLVLRLHRPWGIAGLVKRIDGDNVLVVWEDGNQRTHNRAELCLAENADRRTVRSARPQYVKR
jgi:hypothetical protein